MISAHKLVGDANQCTGALNLHPFSWSEGKNSSSSQTSHHILLCASEFFGLGFVFLMLQFPRVEQQKGLNRTVTAVMVCAHD